MFVSDVLATSLSTTPGVHIEVVFAKLEYVLE